MEEKILEKLESIDVKFNDQLSALDTKITSQFSTVNKKLNEHTEQIDFIALKVAEHDTDITWLKENAATKDDLRKSENRIVSILDEMMGMMKKRDQEVTLIHYRTQGNTEEIKQIKSFVHFK